MSADELPVLVRALHRSYSEGCPDPLLMGVDEGRSVRDELIAWFGGDLGPLLNRSHVHTNGFLKFARPLPNQPEVQVRLHHWPADWPQRWSSIHSHRWDFISLVLAGHLDERLYDYEDDPATGSEQLFDYQPHDLARGGAEQVVARNRVDLRLSSEHRRDPGNLQFLRGYQLHQIKARPASTTLVLRGPLKHRRAQIAMPLGHDPRLADDLQAMTPQQIGDVLGELGYRYQSDAELPTAGMPLERPPESA